MEGKTTVTSNQGKDIDISPSEKHTVTEKNPGLKGEPDSSTDILDSEGNVQTRRGYDSEGRAYRDVDFGNHGNPLKHPEYPHSHEAVPQPDGSISFRGQNLP